jgi:hypothetical protein
MLTYLLRMVNRLKIYNIDIRTATRMEEDSRKNSSASDPATRPSSMTAPISENRCLVFILSLAVEQNAFENFCLASTISEVLHSSWFPALLANILMSRINLSGTNTLVSAFAMIKKFHNSD